MAAQLQDIVIIGGGVMGLLSARELAARGLRVAVLDQGDLAGEASWAGGGIVSPLYPWRYSSAITALVRSSQAAYLRLAPALREETGIDPELRAKGLLMLAVEDRAEALRWAHENQAVLEAVSSDFAAELEPCVDLRGAAPLWMPNVCSIRNPRLGQALRRSLELNPQVTLHPECRVSTVVTRNGQVSAIEAGGKTWIAAKYLVSAGAWSGQLLSQLGLSLPITPVKGQMLLFNTPGGLLERVVLKDGRYLIPRSDGRILVGSTLEQDGFAKTLTVDAYQSLYRSATALLPALAEQPIEAQWAGLRPGSPGGIPFIGVLPGYSNLFINAGQFRNGLVLAPASCELAAQLICDEHPALDPAPYAVDAVRGDQLL